MTAFVKDENFLGVSKNDGKFNTEVREVHRGNSEEEQKILIPHILLCVSLCASVLKFFKCAIKNC
ncbi:MAG: hypothetical protein Ta2F_00630 [Termitinemataceae bacterium]|nr:MAG: hypothetical protein Ta2F_00630 [Termitinemataceae bacterium]